MKRKSGEITGVVLVLGVLLLLPLFGACDDGGSDNGAKTGPGGERVITIGNHTDLTQVPGNAVAYFTMPLEDMAQYYNDRDLIPGVRFDVKVFDGRYNPGQDKPGYELLKKQGADMIFSPPPHTAVSLKALLEQDRMALFCTAPFAEAVDPPGWVFGIGSATEYETYTLLKWVAENDPAFPADRPARIGAALWDEPYAERLLIAAEAYCRAHPDQYEWVYGALTPWKFNWETEVEILKDCDYVIPNGVMPTFAEQYRAAGGQARFVAPEAHLILIGQIAEADLWEEIDGTLYARTALWWNDEGEGVDLMTELLYEYRPQIADEIIERGVGYTAAQHLSIMFKLIEETIAVTGPDGFDSQALYDTAQSFSTVLDGCPHSFNSTKRVSSDAIAVYEVDAIQKTIVRADPEWIPVEYQP